MHVNTKTSVRITKFISQKLLSGCTVESQSEDKLVGGSFKVEKKFFLLGGCAVCGWKSV